LTNRTILVIGLILVIAIATNWFIEITEQQPPPATMARNDPDLYMVNAEMTQFNEKGEMEQQISAQRMTHFPLTDVTTLKAPNLKLYSAPEEAPWDIVALNGRMLPKALLRDEIVELWDRVLAVRQQPDGDYINIRTESLTVHPKKDLAETSDKVLIDNPSGNTSAGGMKAWFQPGRFEFFSRNGERVETVILSPGNREARDAG